MREREESWITHDLCLSHCQDGSSFNRNGETVGGKSFGRKIRGSVLDMMPIRYPIRDVKKQLD